MAAEQDEVEAPRADRAARSRGDIAALLTRSALAQVLGIVRSFVILPVLGPAQLGTFRLLQQLTAYSQYLSLGAFSTLNVKYAEWEAAGDRRRCEVVDRLALRQSLLGTLLFVPIFAALAWGTDLSQTVFAVLCLTSGFPLLADYVGVSYNVRGLFREVARIDVVVSVLGLATLIAGAVVWGLPGALLASFLPPIFRVLLGRRFLRPKGASASRAEAFQHFHFGLRIWAASTLGSFAQTVDLVLLGWLLAEASPVLGYYAVGLMVTQVLAQNLAAITVVQQRALRVQIGESGSVAAPGIAQETRRLMGIDAFVGVCFAAAAIVAAYVAFPLVLPAYGGVLPGLGALLASLLFIKSRTYTRVILQNADRPGLALVAPILQLAILFATYPAVVRHEPSLLTLGLLRLASFLPPALLEVMLAYAVMGRAAEGGLVAAQLVLGLVPIALGFTVIPVLADHGAWSCAGPVLTVAGCFLLYNALFDGAGREGAALLRQVLRRFVPRHAG